MEEFFKFIGGSAIALGILAYLIKSLTKHLLDKDISVYKLELQNVAYEHQVRFEKLQTTRGEVIAKLYELLVSTDIAMQSATFRIENLREEEEWFDVKKDKFIKARDRAIEFEEYYSLKRIYFSDEFCALMDNFVKELRKDQIDLFVYIDQADINDKELRNQFLKTWEAVSKDPLPEMKKQLENEFRKMLGVD